MSQLKRKKMCRRPMPIVKSKKGFIASILVDFWAVIMFVLVVVIFAFLYKWTSKKAEEKLSVVHGTMWNNYLAELYLRTPLQIRDVEMTMAELIALYDYNQTNMRFLKLKDKKEKNWYEKLFLEANEVLEGNTARIGDDNPLWQGLDKLTTGFIEDNFDAYNTCWLFGIEGNGFKFLKHGSGSKCKKYADTYIEMGVWSASAGYKVTYEQLFGLLKNVPVEAYTTYVPPIDPTWKPIKVYIVYDIEKTLKLEEKDEEE